MKKLLFIGFLFLTTVANAQIDSSEITDTDPKIPVTLKKVHFGHIWRSMTPAERGSVDGFWLLSQVLPQLTADTTEAGLNELITATVRESFLIERFKRMGDMREGLMNGPNTEMKAALLPQIQNRPSLMKAIGTLMKINAEEAKRNAYYGIQEMLNAKQ